MVIFFLCIGIVSGTSYVGYVFALYYKKRKQFFLDYVDFLNHAKTQITFLQNRLINIYDSFASGGSDFEKLIKDIAVAKEIKKPVYLKPDEWMVVEQFIKNLGRCDVESECANIEAALQKVHGMYLKSENECEKKYSLCLKLGVAVGIAISIIIV